MKTLPLLAVLAVMTLALALILSCDNNDDHNDTNDDDDDDDNDNDTTDDDDNNDDDTSPSDDDDDDDNDDDDTPLPEGIYVAKSGDDTNPGDPDQPLLTIAAAQVVAAAQNVPIFVAQGVYEEYLEITTSLYGGYRATDWARDIDAYETVVESPGATAMVVGMSPDVAVKELEGFTIRARNEDGENLIATVRVEVGPLTIRHNRIEGGPTSESSYDTYSIALAIHAVEPITLENNQFVGGLATGANAGSYGIGVFDSAESVTLRDNVAEGGPVMSQQTAESTGLNISAGAVQVLAVRNVFRGGNSTSVLVAFSDGVDVEDGSATFIANFCEAGRATGPGYLGTGAALHQHLEAEPLLLIANTFVAGPSALSDAVYLESDGALIGNILSSNVGNSSNALRLSDGAADVTLLNNDLFCASTNCVLLTAFGAEIDDLDEVNECGWFSCTNAGDNIAAAPRFVGESDFHIKNDSPCIGAGLDPTPWYDEEDAYLDIDGDSRPADSTWDIGADEFVAQE